MSLIMPQIGTGTADCQTEVEQEFVRVSEHTNFIDEILGALEERLSKSILAQRKEEKSNGPENPEPVRVPLAQSLYEHGSKLERIRERLSSILSRIEA